eukprot:CAMPEP_0201251678 /NCGR_PEP_ID=MMETSP0852-20130820/66480_1 /ASSEMBLY_ACC=CAM_ASM_000632 /TAXON_ID=183588 /ORGANISM="Pseudo-nitzschia fraudulenta, Strain WWA7" /LENGTH=179 /DNA_ID=CAMNT_0047551287 /DNA_START=41 /DNA_END=580 /DNA_ORIENTATION=+
MMFVRQRSLLLATLALLAFVAQQETGVHAQGDDKQDKDADKEDGKPVEVDVILTAPPADSLTASNVTDDELELPFAIDENTTGIMMEDEGCTCDDNMISCIDPADEVACLCEDGDVVCVDVVPETLPEPETLSEQEPVTADETEPPQKEVPTPISGASAPATMVAVAVAAVGVVALAWN